jgi:hypothetical protein
MTTIRIASAGKTVSHQESGIYFARHRRSDQNDETDVYRHLGKDRGHAIGQYFAEQNVRQARPDRLGRQYIALLLFGARQVICEARVPWPPHCGDRHHAVNRARFEESGDRHRQNQRRNRQEDVGEAHQGVAPRRTQIAGEEADHDADRRRDREDDDRHFKRQTIGVDDAGEEIATDRVGSQEILAAWLRAHRGKIAHGSSVARIGGDQIGE